MAVFTIKSFGGISPKVPPRYLQDSQAQVAINCPVFSGSIQPLSNLSSTVTTLTRTGTPQTIYRFGKDLDSDTQYWFSWNSDVNVCRGQVAGDTSEWTFYTGDGAPKATYNSLALAGTPYPFTSRPLGIPNPTVTPNVTLGAAPDPATATETRSYVFTWVNKEAGFEFESGPSAPSALIDVMDGQSVTVSGFGSLPGGYTITHRRIYRAVSGTYLFVAEIAVATSSYVDTKDPDSLGEELPSATWLPPPSTLAGLINMPNGVMAGFVGQDVYLCDPYHPHAWPLEYVQTVDYSVVGLGRMDTTLAVLTKGTPYFIQGATPDTAVVVKSDLEQACASKRSIVSTNGVVIYASPDGLIMLTPGGSRMLTENYFTRAQWQAYFVPTSIHAYSHDLKYVAFYNNGVTSGGFIYDLTSGQFILHDIYVTAGFTDLQRDQLFVTSADRTIKKWLGGSAKTYTWRSKKFTLPEVAGFNCAMLEAETYPMTAKFYMDGTLFHTQTVTSRDMFRLPVAMGRDFEVQFEGSAEVFSFSVAQSPEELASV